MRTRFANREHTDRVFRAQSGTRPEGKSAGLAGVEVRRSNEGSSFGFGDRIVRELRTMTMLFYFLVLLMLERADDTCRRAQTAGPFITTRTTEALDGYLSEYRSIRTCRRSG
jgi:hypothetical protein